jgi:hypothetical protein
MCLIGKDFVCEKRWCSTAGTANQNYMKVQVNENAADIGNVTEHLRRRNNE